MSLTISILPYEIISAILEQVATLNIKDGVQYTYGLSQAPEPLQNVQMQKVLRGLVTPDALRWNATQSIRQVRRQWHDWAVSYALKTLRLSQWMGGERWIKSNILGNPHEDHSSIAVYRDPHNSLRKTAEIFAGSKLLGSCVRSIWFNGYHTPETTALIFNILRSCTNVDSVTLPWTALRYGSAEDWSCLLSRNEERRAISSLELLSVNLKISLTSDCTNRVDKKPLLSPRVNFSGLRRLKVFGDSNFMPLTDEDLILISQTASNLRELHINGAAMLSNAGIYALVDSSDETLEVLEHSPIAADGSKHPESTAAEGRQDHVCRTILRCPRLHVLSMYLPKICEDLFADSSVQWGGDTQIYTSTVCGFHPLSLKTSDKARAQFWRVVDRARQLMLSREKAGVYLNIEIRVNDWIFQPRNFLVHGNLWSGKLLSDGTWPLVKAPSSKGPYGFWGKDDGPYECISEEEFKQGLTQRYVSF